MSIICVVGLGYIGLPVASMLASRGHDVIGCDIDEDVVRSINSGRAHFFEPDLDMLLAAAVSTGRLRARTTPSSAEYFIIAVPTPIGHDKTPDLTYVKNATVALASSLRPGAIVILESTSPVGTTERIASDLAELRPDLKLPRFEADESSGHDIHVAHCPERILPGLMLKELVNNDRIIGGVTPTCAERAAGLYRSFVTGNCFLTDCRTAEFVKLVENASRDVSIAFVNELSVICDRLGMDVWRTIELANKHPRVSLLQPGVGVGGHCIAVDPWFIVDTAPEQTRLIRAAREINDAKPHHIATKILAQARRLREPVVACYGLAYKPDIEDVRESPAVEVVRELSTHETMRVLVCDPYVKELPRILLGRPNVTMVDADEARREADIVAFLVGHKLFREFDFNLFRDKLVVDAIGLTSKKQQRSSSGGTPA